MKDLTDQSNNFPAQKEEEQDFFVHKFYAYSGPNYYLDRQAMVFNLWIDPEGYDVEYYRNQVIEKFPEIEEDYPGRVAELFAKVLSCVFKMDMNLFTRKYHIERDGEEWTIAMESLNDYLAEEAIYFVSDWFVAMNKNDRSFDFDGEFARLQEIFDKSMLGGPTIYSLIEGAIKREINVHYLYEENQFQWGYGKKQIRGRSTIFHIDGIKDTEFTSYKDMVGEFLEMCGFPTPKGRNCYTVEELKEAVEELGFPLVVKPVAGHKGQGVTTGIQSEEQAITCFNNIVKAAKEEGVAFDGALAQQQIYGYDHRILVIGGKYAATLKRVPAYVVGNGTNTIKELIETENAREIRADTARSPLAKIYIDDDLIDYLQRQNLSLDSIPKRDEEIVLRRVANISAGGVSINVTNDIHPTNIQMVENIAKFLNVTVLGIDVLAKDIGRPWNEGDFGIIEINAGPGVFMHLAPAEGGSVDIPGKIMEHLFGKIPGFDRIPIICGNNISSYLIEKIHTKLREYKSNIELGSIRKDGVYFNSTFFTKNPAHDTNIAILLRNPKLDFAIINHTRDNIHDYGMWHQGMDVAILNRANYAEQVMERDVMKDGLVIEIEEVGLDEEELIEKLQKELDNIKNALRSGEEVKIPESNLEKIETGETKTIITLRQNDVIIKKLSLSAGDNIDDAVYRLLEPYLFELLFKYEYYLKLENNPENLNINRRFVKEV